MDRIIQGDTFAPLCIIKNRKGVPVDLTGCIITAEVFCADFNFHESIPCTVAVQDNNSRGVFVLGPVSTECWPAGTVTLQITRSFGPIKSSVRTNYRVEV